MSIYAALGTASGEITEKKSRFIATVKEIHSEEEAAAFIESLRKQYWDARHNCYAYILGPNNEIQRFSDDKEPQGTAGKPILDTLLGTDIRNCIIVVTRYFGGVLLGTGGLVRAYTEASLAGIEALKNSKYSETGSALLPITEGHRIKFHCGYKDISRFESLIIKFGMCTISKEYLEDAIYTMMISSDSMASFLKEAGNITRGAFALENDDVVTYCQDGFNALPYVF